MFSLQVQVPAEREIMVGYGTMGGTLDAIEGALNDREFLVGDSFTAADLYVGAHLGWGMSFDAIEKRPVFVDYVARLNARPAAIRAVQIDDALMSAQPAE